MKTQTTPILFILAISLLLSLAACGTNEADATATSAPVQSPDAPATSAPTQAPAQAQSGFITGRVHGQAPPTPPSRTRCPR